MQQFCPPDLKSRVSVYALSTLYLVQLPTVSWKWYQPTPEQLWAISPYTTRKSTREILSMMDVKQTSVSWIHSPNSLYLTLCLHLWSRYCIKNRIKNGLARQTKNICQSYNWSLALVGREAVSPCQTTAIIQYITKHGRWWQACSTMQRVD